MAGLRIGRKRPRCILSSGTKGFALSREKRERNAECRDRSPLSLLHDPDAGPDESLDEPDG
jgi:hypothetical protein